MFENFLEKKKNPSDGVKSKCFAHKCSNFLSFIFLRNYMIAIENKILIYHKELTWGFFFFFSFFFCLLWIQVKSFYFGKIIGRF